MSSVVFFFKFELIRSCVKKIIFFLLFPVSLEQPVPKESIIDEQKLSVETVWNGYSKENSKVLYSDHKMKILNSFSGIIFNRDRIQYEFGALDMESSKIYFFLPSATDRIEEINRYMNSVNLIPIHIYQNEFEVDSGNLDLSNVDFDNPDKQKTREAVLRVLKKVVDLSNSNLQKNADGLLASKPHNKDILWVGYGGKRVPENVFALSY